MRSIITWLKAARASFFTTSFVSILLGTSIAFSETGHIAWIRALLALGGVAACHAGSNLVNDYYDHLSTNDDINEYRSPFNGGSGCIQEGIVAPLSMRNAGLLCYFISIVFGIILSSLLNIWGLLLVLLGIAFGFSYSRFPGLSYYGLGELMVGISFGPLIVASVYYAQMGYISHLAVVASLPIGLLVAAVVYINQFPDYEADKGANKKNLVVRLGRRRALPYYYLLLGTAYLIIFLGVLYRILPPIAIIVFLTLPFAVAAAYWAAKWYEKPKQILPANACTVAIHVVVGILLIAAFTWNAF